MRLMLPILAIFLAWTTQVVHAGSYRFQPGDTVQISVWQEPKLDRQVVVAPDGSIAIPLVGRVAAGRRSAAQIEASIKGRLSETYQGDLDVTVSFVSRPEAVEREDEKIDPLIFVMGEVNRPGQFPIKVRTTVLQALALGGGLSPFAADKRIRIHRKVKGEDILYEFNFREFDKGTDLSGNIALRPGDVVVVPERGLFE